MAIECPHCRCSTPHRPYRMYGPVFTTQNQIPIKGGVDERSGSVFMDDDASLTVTYELRSSSYMIVRCIECSGEFVALNYPVAVVHPRKEPNVEPAPEIPEPVRGILFEAKKAHSVGLETCSLLGARTALIRMQRQQECKGIDDLVAKGVITPFLARQANEVRLWGNVTAHEDVPPEHPESADVEQLLGFLDLLFDTVYVQPARLEALKAKRSQVGGGSA